MPDIITNEIINVLSKHVLLLMDKNVSDPYKIKQKLTISDWLELVALAPGQSILTVFHNHSPHRNKISVGY